MEIQQDSEMFYNLLQYFSWGTRGGSWNSISSDIFSCQLEEESKRTPPEERRGQVVATTVEEQNTFHKTKIH